MYRGRCDFFVGVFVFLYMCGCLLYSVNNLWVHSNLCLSRRFALKAGLSILLCVSIRELFYFCVCFVYASVLLT